MNRFIKRGIVHINVFAKWYLVHKIVLCGKQAEAIFIDLKPDGFL